MFRIKEYLNFASKELNICFDITPEDEGYLKNNTADFFTYSYYASDMLGGEGNEAGGYYGVGEPKLNPYLKASMKDSANMILRTVPYCSMQA